jgi:hypothetical protein
MWGSWHRIEVFGIADNFTAGNLDVGRALFKNLIFLESARSGRPFDRMSAVDLGIIGEKSANAIWLHCLTTSLEALQLHFRTSFVGFVVTIDQLFKPENMGHHLQS